MVTRRTLAVAVVVVSMLGLGLFAGFTASARATARACSGTSYSDPVGDAPSGVPDITGVCISTGATGPLGASISIEIDAAGLNDFISVVPAGEVNGLWMNIDADRNPATGDPSGFDYAIAVEHVQGALTAIFIGQWIGGSWQVENSVTMPMFDLNSGSLTGTIGTADLGGTTHFTFDVETGKAPPGGNPFAEDRAPDKGMWDYTLTSTSPPTTPVATVRPVIGAPSTTPARAIAGKHLTVSFPVTRSDTGKPLTAGTMICDPSVQGKVISHSESFTGGTAKLSFLIPKSARGGTLRVKVTIKLGNESATRVANFRVG